MALCGVKGVGWWGGMGCCRRAENQEGAAKVKKEAGWEESPMSAELIPTGIETEVPNHC